MSAENYAAAIQMCHVEQVFLYRRTPMLTLSVNYPQVALVHVPWEKTAASRTVSAQVRDFCCYASSTLYCQAIDAYKNAGKNGFPFNRHEALLNYKVTYNQRCHLSLYRDQYTYTGGAHGSTVRASDTYDLAKGCRLSLACLFPDGRDYRAFLIEQILFQADRQMQDNPMVYFDDYRALIAQQFNDNSYYLTPTGVAIYFQQYEIAPYSTGIVVFTVPYETLPWQPDCPCADEASGAARCMAIHQSSDLSGFF